MERWQSRVLSIAFLIALAFISSVGGWAKEPEKVVILGDYSTLRTLDPAFIALSQDIMLCRAIHQSLLRYKLNSSDLEGDLAKSWAVSNNGLVYTFKLREDAVWHKGFGKCTARDVKYTFDRILDPETKASARSELAQDIDSIRVLNDYTVEFRLKSTCAPFLHKLVGPRPTSIVSQKAVEKFGKDYGRNPIGTGPFVFDSWSREQCVLVANREFTQRQGPPKIDKVIYKIIPDVDTTIMALQKGEIDIVWVLPREAELMERLKASGCKISYTKRPTWQQLFMNTKKKPFDDVRVRRAIAHAIDKDVLVKHVFSRMAERLDSLIPRGYFGHTEEGIPRYDYNPAKARELLAQAGYPNGISVTMDTHSSPSLLPLAQAIAEQLRQVNISVKLAVTDQATWWGKLSKGNTDFAHILPAYQPDADFVMMRYYHSSAFSPGLNVSRYDQMDELIDKARMEMNEKKRLEYYREIQKKLGEDLPVIPLMMMQYPIAYRDYLSGVPDYDNVFGIDFYFLRMDKK